MDDLGFYKTLIKRYKDKTATKEEEFLFFKLLREGKIDSALLKEMDEQLEEGLYPPITSTRKKKPFIALLPYAASILLLLGLIAYYNLRTNKINTGNPAVAKAIPYDVSAGTHKAILTLADGRQIPLDSNTSEELKKTVEISLHNPKVGLLVYKSAGRPQDSVQYHQIRVPLGGQYQVVLPDQSKVWLNAGSSLRFPVTFSAHKRELFLEGEAYFEVKKALKPFTVVTAHQQVQVLGTSFNVKAYTDEQQTVTTLLSGSVKIKAKGIPAGTGILKPNQQAINVHRNGTLNKVSVEAKDFVAWKDGYFVFHHTKMADAMQQIARWYDVEIDVKQMPEKYLYAVLPKDVKLSALLEMIALTSNTKFKLTERRVSL
ncbi:FecR domain-containing protein [Olivibacter sp. CPCC 100613]|uniref:FecR family protein n=1 Tax=Olivibacter sp. CPCC 100613 TaxID=3079931 RepID=UPI002FF6F008